jgi:hypothetical protein
MRIENYLKTSGAALALMLLAACSSSEDVQNQADVAGGPQEVRISITHAAGINTRTGVEPSAPVGSAALNVDKGGFLFFVDGTGAITKAVTVENSSYSYTDPENAANVPLDTKVRIDELEGPNGGIIRNVPYSSKRVHIYMNLPHRLVSEFKEAIAGEIVGRNFAATIGDKTTTAFELTDGGATATSPNYGVDSVAVSGYGLLQAEPDYSKPYSMVANVALKAIASRIEISQISFDAPTGATVEEFTISTILINNYYKQAELDGVYLSDIVDWGVEKNFYREDHEYFKYIVPENYASKLFTSGGKHQGTNMDGSAYDILDPIIDNDGAAGNAVVVPNQAGKTGSDDLVWAFNIFPNDLAPQNTPAFLPHIVIYIKKLVINDPAAVPQQQIIENKWVTVKGYTNPSNGHTVVTNFDRGYAYRIGGLNGIHFTREDISEYPEGKSISVAVTATLIPWQTVDVDPKF